MFLIFISAVPRTKKIIDIRVQYDINSIIYEETFLSSFNNRTI